MGNEYLATGFAHVDQAQNKKAYFDCLRLLDALPYYQDCKNRSYDYLELHPGLTVLDAGCGLGDDVFRMVKCVLPDGKVFGLDASQAMIDKARQRASLQQLPVEFEPGDVRALPFPDHCFDRCRIDRTLQHIPEPQKAIAEMVRVLKPGGLLLAYDNDWNSFSIGARTSDITDRMVGLWRESFTNPTIGRLLPEYFASAGLNHVKIYPGTSVIADFKTANQIYNLQETVYKAVDSGMISPSQGDRWIQDLVDSEERGVFSTTLTAYTVTGKKDGT